MSSANPSRKGSNHPTSPPIPFASAETVESPARVRGSGGTSAPAAGDSGTGNSASASGAPVDPELLAGKRLGKYQIVRMLGKGGMGTVFEALDIVLHRKVALKVLPREFSENDEALKRFIREARLAARLNHPNAVAVYDVGRKGTTYYIAMELVRGASAQQMLETSHALGWREATQWIADACRALSAAHSAGLVHRDIKPSNMLCSESGAVKLSDFGLAKPTDAKSHLTLTQKDSFIGTPLFMSPEQCRNDKTDGRADIYGLGATYYTLLAGEPPYHEGTALQILFAHCSAPIPDVCAKNTSCPPLCGEIVQRAMAKDPAQRYQSADEMLADLEAVLNGATASTRDPMLAAMEGLAPDPALSTIEPGALPAPSLWQSPVAARRQQRLMNMGIAAGAAILVLGGLIAVLVARSGGDEAPPVSVAKAEPAPAVNATPSPAPAVAPVPVEQPPAPDEKTAAPEQATPPLPPVAMPATQPLTLAVAAPKEAVTPEPSAPQTPAQPVEQPKPEPPAPADMPPDNEPPPPAPEASADANLPSDPALRAYVAAKKWAHAAKTRNDVKSMERGARTLILWHDFFTNSPHAFHTPYVEESAQLAEQLVPGIGAKFPRVQLQNVAGGPPVPPKIQPGQKPPADAPEAGERPQPPARKQPPPKRTK